MTRLIDMRRIGALIAAGFLLTACAPTVIHGCPAVPSWSEAESAELADEIAALPPEADKIERALIEARTMREQARACK